MRDYTRSVCLHPGDEHSDTSVISADGFSEGLGSPPRTDPADDTAPPTSTCAAATTPPGIRCPDTTAAALGIIPSPAARCEDNTSMCCSVPPPPSPSPSPVPVIAPPTRLTCDAGSGWEGAGAAPIHMPSLCDEEMARVSLSLSVGLQQERPAQLQDADTQTSLMWDVEVRELEEEVTRMREAKLDLEFELERERHRSLVEARSAASTPTVLPADLVGQRGAQQVALAEQLQHAQDDAKIASIRADVLEARCEELEEELRNLRNADREARLIASTTVSSPGTDAHDKAIIADDDVISSIAQEQSCNVSLLNTTADERFHPSSRYPQGHLLDALADTEEMAALKAELLQARQREEEAELRCEEALQELDEAEKAGREVNDERLQLIEELEQLYTALRDMEAERAREEAAAVPRPAAATREAETQTHAAKQRGWVPGSAPSECPSPATLSPFSCGSPHSERADRAEGAREEAEARQAQAAAGQERAEEERDAALRQCGELSEELAETTRCCDELRQELAETLNSRTHMSNELVELTRVRGEMDGQLQRLRGDLEATASRRADSEGRLASLREQVDASARQKAAVQQDLTQALARHAEREAAAVEAEQRADKAEALLRDAEARAVEAEARAETHGTQAEEELLEARRKAEVAQQQAEDAKHTVREHERRSQAYEAELRKLRCEVADLSEAARRLQPAQAFGASLLKCLRSLPATPGDEEARKLVVSIVDQRAVWWAHLRHLATLHTRARQPELDEDATTSAASALADRLRMGEGVDTFFKEFTACMQRLVEDKRTPRVVIPAHGFNRNVAAAAAAVGRALKRCTLLRASFAKNMYTVRASDSQEIADVVSILEEAGGVLSGVLDAVPRDERRTLRSPRAGTAPRAATPPTGRPTAADPRRPLRELGPSSGNVVRVVKRVVKRTASQSASASSSASAGVRRCAVEQRLSFEQCATPPHRRAVSVQGGLQPSRLF